MAFPYLTFYLVINLFVWIAESYLDASGREIQCFYAYPVAIALIFLPTSTVAGTAIPLILCIPLYFLTRISKDNWFLTVIYFLSTAPFILYSTPILLVVAGIYLFGVREFTDIKENITTAPAGAIAVLTTYLIGTLI